MPVSSTHMVLFLFKDLRTIEGENKYFWKMPRCISIFGTEITLEFEAVCYLEIFFY